MGGQACVFYGAAEFTRDIDVLVPPTPADLARLRAALDDLNAESVHVPPLSSQVLQQGHACHFRCHAQGAERLRIDVMSTVRGCGAFPTLWKRRREILAPGLGWVALLSPVDLVLSKKTQRDKDWPMIARLVEADYRSAAGRAAANRIRFWLMEARSVELLNELVTRFPRQAAALAARRRAVARALRHDFRAVRAALHAEQEHERAADQRYWAPLRQQLEQWRHEQAQRGR
jgi:hypothetical protein